MIRTYLSLSYTHYYGQDSFDYTCSHFKPISNSPDRLNILRLGRIKFDLLTDLLDMHGNRRNVADGLHVPDLIKELFLRKYMVGILG